MKASTLFWHRLADLGVEDVFTVPGGAVMHLSDSLHEEPRLKVWAFHDERVASMAAEGYARVKGKPGALLVSSGPAVLNALNGVWGAYVDSVPMIVVAGQVRSDTVKRSTILRQLGDQELEMSQSIVKHFNVFNESILHPETAADNLWVWSRSHRPGPVWLEWSVDQQAVDVSTRNRALPPLPKTSTNNVVSSALEVLSKAKRPVVVVGGGVAHNSHWLRRFLDTTLVPCVTAFRHDQVYHTHSCWIGRQGTLGDRAGNWAAQNADLLLVVGCRMSLRQVTYDWRNFSPGSTRIMVDVDEAEMRKPTFRVDLKVQMDSEEFLQSATEAWTRSIPKEWQDWWIKCDAMRTKWPTTEKVVDGRSVPRNHSKNGLDPYILMSRILKELPDDVTVVTGNATAYIVTHQVSDGRHRMFSNSGCASMGYGLPAAIGAAIAGSKVLCVEGDGSIMQCLSAFASLSEWGLPVNVVVLCNDGYASIKSTHGRIFGRPAIEPRPFVWMETLHDLAKTFDLHFSSPWGSVDGGLLGFGGIIDFKGPPGIAACTLDPSIPIEPRLEARLVDGQIVSATLDKMTPEVEL